ncbi:MAG: hypothetical protein UF067_08960, partial [Paludibacteraceae bacterium]|nr:hypothetical protein [Paludibacteraceae bacterium]
MAKNIRKMLALVLVMCMFVSALPMQALAAERGERFSKTQVTRGEHKKFEGRSATAKTARAAAPAAAAATSEGFTKTETFTGSNVKIDYTEGESGKQNIAVSGTNSSGAELKDFSGTSESKSDSYEDANTGSTIQKDSTHVEISGTESADGVDKKVDYMEDKTTTTETETNGTVTEQTIVDGLETKKWTENDVGDGEQPDVSADIPLEAGKSDVGTATTVTQTGNATSQEGQTTTTTTDRTVTTQT